MSEAKSEEKEPRVRVRYAPSPTGLQHIGGLRTALYNYLFAKKMGGDFLLRIEDTDQKRFVEGALENTIGFLRDFGLHYEEGPILLTDKDQDNDSIGTLSSRYPGIYELGPHAPYIQSERLDQYQKYADELVKKGLAYHCFCTTERLEELRSRQESHKLAPRYDRECLKLTVEAAEEKRKNGDKSVIRFKIPEKGKFVVTDILRGEMESDTKTLDDFVLMKSDGYPTYHLASIIDDHLMIISHVLRGIEWLPSLPKHVLLYEAFGWDKPQFVHLPVILGQDGKKKLSKREGDVSVDAFVEMGYLREALLNFIALLGWNPGKGSTQEIFTVEELAALFSLEHLNKAGAVFDRAKLDWMNHEYIVKKTVPELLALIKDGKFLEKKEWFTKALPIYQADEYLLRVITIEQERLKTLAAVGDDSQFLFVDSLTYDAALLHWKENSTGQTREALEKAKSILFPISEEGWTREGLTKTLMDAAGEKRGDFLWPLRVALSGLKQSPSPMDIAWVLGRERAIKRLEDALHLLA